MSDDRAVFYPHLVFCPPAAVRPCRLIYADESTFWPPALSLSSLQLARFSALIGEDTDGSDETRQHYSYLMLYGSRAQLFYDWNKQPASL